MQLQVMAARVLGELPTDEADTERATITTKATPTTLTNGGTVAQPDTPPHGRV
jgi:hypothetical protein